MLRMNNVMKGIEYKLISELRFPDAASDPFNYPARSLTQTQL